MQPAKTKINRSAKRGHYDKETIYKILDSAFICHIAFIYEGYPVNIPTLYGRRDHYLYLHGAGASRMLKVLEQGLECSCLYYLVGWPGAGPIGFSSFGKLPFGCYFWQGTKNNFKRRKNGSFENNFRSHN